MKHFIRLLCVFASVQASAAVESLCTQIKDLKHCHGGEWKIAQSALDQGKMILRYRMNGSEEEVNLFVTSDTQDLKAMVADGVQTKSETADSFAGLEWKILQIARGNEVHATLFKSTFRGTTYYGYSASKTNGRANKNAIHFLSGLNSEDSRSLTGPEFKGKKYYFGFGAAMSFDPAMMQNEVKYDVLHTHDIFTKEIGGSYSGVKYTDYNTATSTNIKAAWADLKSKITPADMYVQYSSGHGSQSGLAVGFSWDVIRDQVLAFNAKETIVFTMACYSGNLVNSFNKKKTEWENFQSQGKTLFVMGSSKASETSSTGPGTDPEEAGPNGSAGSAFGHALWKALIGYADGEKSGVKDGYLNLEEIRDFTVKKTVSVGGHTPQHTGAYDAKLIMNRVPPKPFLESIGVTSEELSDQEVAERIRQLDSELRI